MPTTTPVSQARVDDADLLRAFLAGRDTPCPQCGYNLRDLTGNRCPECGEELTLRLQLSEPKQAAALAGLIALTAGAGFNALMLGYWVVMAAIRGFGWNLVPLEFVVVNVGGTVAMGLLIALWLRYWRHVRRLGVIRRWVLVVACATLSVADLIIFAKVMQ